MKNKSAVILQVLGIAGMIGGEIFTGAATVKAVRLLDKKKERKEPVKEEAARAALKYYIPPLLLTTGAIACLIGAGILGCREQVALASTIALTEESYRLFREKTKEVCGEESYEEIKKEIATEKCKDIQIRSPGFAHSISTEFDKDTDEKHLFYDLYSDRYFENTNNRVLQAEYALNRNFALRGGVTVNEFYEFLGLPRVKGGDKLGWDAMEGDMQWIDFDHMRTTVDDGLEVTVLDMVFLPTPIL